MDHSYDIPGEDLGIYEGAMFSSLEEFQAALARYSRMTNTVYNIHKSQLIQGYHQTGHSSLGFKSKFPALSPRLKYMYAMYGCKHYGVARSRSKGIRPNQKTFKTGCLSHISLMTDRKRGKLVVKTAVLEHNHHLGPDMARLYPENRRLSGGPRRHIHVRSMPRDAKNLREVLLTVSRPGEPPAPKQYPTSQHKVVDEGEGVDDPLYSPPEGDPVQQEYNVTLEQHAEVLHAEYGCCAELYRREGEFKGVFVWDAGMAETYDAFPEYLCVDTSCTLLQTTPVWVYMFAVEDSSGWSEMVGLGLMLSEDDDAIGWLLTAFRGRNVEASDKTKIVINNGPSEQDDALRRYFPDCRHLLNPAQCLRAWKRDVARGVTGVTEDGSDLAHHLLDRVLHATSKEAYDQAYAEMQSALPYEVFEYFNARWHPERERWTFGVSFGRCDVFASAITLTERSKRRLGLRSGDVSIPAFFRRFFEEIRRQHAEYDRVSLQTASKTPCDLRDTELPRYADELTSYALSLVATQYSMIEECKPFDYIDNTAQGTISVPISSCLCPFFVSMQLPCRHIFVRRRFLGVEAFDASLFAKRWTRAFYVERRRRPAREEDGPRIERERHRVASELCERLATVMSTMPDDKFEERMEQLRRLCESWRRNEDVTLAPVDGELVEADGMLVGEEVEVVIAHTVQEDYEDDATPETVVRLHC